ncbi:sarcosine oxidase subunit gamma [Spelaeicoccus albus]|uniref:Sarcosine oxidase subunit gamma n=1 Tax=Spelaeicoccus albus TaxID=1280376 RepID=A0A7Z0AD30_9MICO|nr:sarcosine oxidase subunit gamma family protein [Spelaeicoccus albus]NYI67191.1 sarcosine oxidase subunit gamma [Spelaeicoccus albus]
MASTTFEQAPEEAAPKVAGGPAELRHSPAEHLAEQFARYSSTGPDGVSLREIPFVTMIAVRVDPGGAAASSMADVLGARLPVRGGLAAAGEKYSVLPQGPDEFIVVENCSADADEAMDPVDPLDALTAARDGGPGLVADVSANRTTFELSGPSARAVLEKSCAIDLHPRAFGDGAVASTMLGKTPVLLWRVGDAFHVMPRSSFADYLGRWLLDGMAEFAEAA